MQQRGLAEFLMAAFDISIRRACRVLQFNPSTYFYHHRRDDQAALVLRLKELAAARVRYGYLRLHVLLRREGWLVNHKRVYRLYKLEGLSLRLKTPKKRLSRQRVEGPPVAAPNECWSMDFVAERLASGRRFRALTIVNNFTRECPAIEVDSSLTGARVAAVLEHLKQTRGVPARLKVDNGPEFVSRALDAWAHINDVKLEFSRPGKPVVLREPPLGYNSRLTFFQQAMAGLFMKRSSSPFKWRHYAPEVILLCVRWYCRYSLSYRDLEEMMQERGLTVDHVTIFRWVQKYAPEINKRIRPHLKMGGTSYRLDETYVKVGTEWKYLYRAVDSAGCTIEFMLSAKRDISAAKRFFKKVMRADHRRLPFTIGTDKHASYPEAFATSVKEKVLPSGCKLKRVKYLNNLIEMV